PATWTTASLRHGLASATRHWLGGLEGRGGCGGTLQHTLWAHHGGHSMTKQQAVKRAILATYAVPARYSVRKDTPTTTLTKLTPSIAEDDIRIRAYELWESAGRPHGQDRELWLQAERELRQAGC